MLPRACRAAPSLPLRSSAIWTLPPSSSARLVHASSAVAAPPPSRSKVPSFLQLRDEGIQTRFIRVVQQDGSLGPLILRDNVLDKMDRQKQRLMKVDQQELGPEDASRYRLSPETNVGICKIVDKKEEYEKEKERTAAKKQKKQTSKKIEKEIQLTWGVAVNDLQHKLKKAQEVIDGHGRIALIITSPKKTKPPPQNDRRMFADMLMDQLGTNSGRATVWKKEEWTGPRTAVFLEGVKQASPKTKKTDTQAASKQEVTQAEETA